MVNDTLCGDDAHDGNSASVGNDTLCGDDAHDGNGGSVVNDAHHGDDAHDSNGGSMVASKLPPETKKVPYCDDSRLLMVKGRHFVC